MNLPQGIEGLNLPGPGAVQIAFNAMRDACRSYGVSNAQDFVGWLHSQADYMASFKNFDGNQWSSNFKSIEKKTCMQCHVKSKINQDCQTCHIYHLNPGFKKKMFSAKKQIPEIQK